MSDPFVDTDVLIRFVTGDDLTKQAAAVRLFEHVEAGRLTIRAPDTVVADAVFVLSSPRLYHLSRGRIRDELVTLLRLRNFRLPNRQVLIRALDIYAATNFDFGDAMILSAMERRKSSVLYSYDHGFDRVGRVSRHEP